MKIKRGGETNARARLVKWMRKGVEYQRAGNFQSEPLSCDIHQLPHFLFTFVPS